MGEKVRRFTDTWGPSTGPGDGTDGRVRVAPEILVGVRPVRVCLQKSGSRGNRSADEPWV